MLRYSGPWTQQLSATTGSSPDCSTALWWMLTSTLNYSIQGGSKKVSCWLETDRNSFSFSAPKMTIFDGFGHFRFWTKLYFVFSFLVSFSAKMTDENPKIINMHSGSVWSVQSRQNIQSQSGTVSLIGHNATMVLVSISLLHHPDSPLLLRHIQAARSYVHRGHSTLH